MPISDQYIMDVDLDTEEDEELIAQKINSEISLSRSYWQEFKNLCTELWFDWLAYKEAIQDKTKSNTFIPLSYVDIMITKSRLKRLFLSAVPLARIKSVPYNPTQSYKLTYLAWQLLLEADIRKFLDILIQDALIFPGAIFQETWGIQTKVLPAFDTYEIPGLPPVRLPRFDPETGRRAFEEQEVREGIFLENIKMDDFYLPRNARQAEEDPWAAKVYSCPFTELENKIDPETRGSFYHNLDQLKTMQSRRSDKAEAVRKGQPLKREGTKEPTFVKTPDIIEFCTDNWIFHVPDGQNFLIRRQRNDYRRKPYHIARVEQVNGEPFGFCPNRANHLMSRTFNEIVDIIMDTLYLEDNKAWVVNEDMVDDYEIGASQGNIIHVHGLTDGVDVQTAVRAIETRAITPEVLPLLEKFDQFHQLVAGRPNTAAGIPTLGAETAYENALLEQGGSARVLDHADNLVSTAFEPLYDDLLHLLQIYFATNKSIEIVGDNGELIERLVAGPGDVYGTHKVEFEFLGKERKKIEEQASMINLLQVWGNLTNIDQVTALLMKNLLINSNISDIAAIEAAMDQAIQHRQLMQAVALQLQMAQAKAAQTKKVGDKQGPVHQSTNTAANATNVLKPVGM